MIAEFLKPLFQSGLFLFAMYYSVLALGKLYFDIKTQLESGETGDIQSIMIMIACALWTIFAATKGVFNG